MGEGGGEPLIVTDRVPLPLPTSLPVLLPLPNALGEWVWVTVQLRDPLPLSVPALAVGGKVPMEGRFDGEGDTDQVRL